MLTRVADSLYWMSRYLERAEHTARLLDVHLNLVPDQQPTSVVHRRERLLQSLWGPLPADGIQSDYQLTDLVIFHRENNNSLLACIASARENARHIREQLSSELWQQINELYLFVRNTRLDDIWYNQPSAFLGAVKQGAHLFQGIADSTLSHGQGWHFIQLARYLERVNGLVRLIDVETRALKLDNDPNAVSDEYGNWLGLLKCATAFEAYCMVYTAHLEPRKIVEFLLLNGEFPHSICFSVASIQDALNAIALATDTSRGARVHRLAGRLRALLDYAQVDEIIENDLGEYLAEILRETGQIHDALYQMYITYPLEDKLVA